MQFNKSQMTDEFAENINDFENIGKNKNEGNVIDVHYLHANTRNFESFLRLVRRTNQEPDDR